MAVGSDSDTVNSNGSAGASVVGDSSAVVVSAAVGDAEVESLPPDVSESLHATPMSAIAKHSDARKADERVRNLIDISPCEVVGSEQSG